MKKIMLMLITILSMSSVSVSYSGYFRRGAQRLYQAGVHRGAHRWVYPAGFGACFIGRKKQGDEEKRPSGAALVYGRLKQALMWDSRQEKLRKYELYKKELQSNLAIPGEQIQQSLQNRSQTLQSMISKLEELKDEAKKHTGMETVLEVLSRVTPLMDEAFVIQNKLNDFRPDSWQHRDIHPLIAEASYIHLFINKQNFLLKQVGPDLANAVRDVAEFEDSRPFWSWSRISSTDLRNIVVLTSKIISDSTNIISSSTNILDSMIIMNQAYKHFFNKAEALLSKKGNSDTPRI